MLKKCASRIYMVLIFAFLYLPIIVLIALSFNDSRSKVKWDIEVTGKNELHSLEGLKELEYYFKDYDIRIW